MTNHFSFNLTDLFDFFLYISYLHIFVHKSIRETNISLRQFSQTVSPVMASQPDKNIEAPVSFVAVLREAVLAARAGLIERTFFRGYSRRLKLEREIHAGMVGVSQCTYLLV